MTTDMRIVFYVPILYSVCGRASVVTSDYLEYIRIEGICEVSREESGASDVQKNRMLSVEK